VGRLACVNVIELPLQLLLRRNPGWLEFPTVVVDEDDPNGEVLWANKKARRHRILPGMRYAQALSLARTLQAGTVTDSEVADSVDMLAVRLKDYTPFVEASDDEPGLFWLNATGLDGLFGSFEEWAGRIGEELREQDAFYTTVVVGFGRFATWAIAQARRGGVMVLESREQEQQVLERVPIRQLHLDPDFRDTLAKLGMSTMGEFLELPPDGVHRRFGESALRLHQMARGDLSMPLTPYYEDIPPGEVISFDAPQTMSTRLIFALKRYLHPLLVQLDDHQEKLAGLELCMSYEDGSFDRVSVKLASPTVDEAQILDLVRLKFESMAFESGVEELDVTAHTTLADRRQMKLFVHQRARDLAAANKALARVRAEFGEDVVVQAKLEPGHLPEATFRWEPVHTVDDPEPADVPQRPLVRRFHRDAHPAPRDHDPDATRLARLAGPYVISGGWWVRDIHRNYHFAETEDGEIVWLYFDERRGRWMEVGSA
jgi:protein ImuB